MSHEENRQPELRRKANELLSQLSPSERESLLIRCWMSHDARWFMAVGREFGMEVANRINQGAVREIGEVEARRLIRALDLPAVSTMADCLLAQEIFVGLFGPDLLEYDIVVVGKDMCKVHVRRCFAYENVMRADIGHQFECGIFARSGGWLEALGVEYEMNPPLGKCLKASGQECVYTFRFRIESHK